MTFGRLLIHPSFDGLLNMAVDAYLVRSKTSPITLRFYTWNPATLSLGHIQKWDERLAARCQKYCIPAVRRETGGRAVLHDQELTYSVCIPLDSPFYNSSLPESYNRINRALVYGLRSLEIDVSQESRKPDLGAEYKKDLGDLCFAATAKSEVLYGGRKLIGSAQRQLRDGLLQHGSLILKMDHSRIAELFFDDPVLQEKAKTKFNRSTACLEEALDSLPGMAELSQAISAGFSREYEIDFKNIELSNNEMIICQSLKANFEPEKKTAQIDIKT
jgi:lipoyl(octanoyl) transferase